VAWPGGDGALYDPRVLVFVGGGVRSGKSRWAVERALGAGERRAFVATARALDEEMAERIARHRLERPEGFDVFEESLLLAELVARLEHDAVVIDCVTLWINNLIMEGHGDFEIDAQVAKLVTAIAAAPDRLVVVVTNEVGLGVVPATPMGRRFRDLSGLAHQRLAEAADEVYFGALGLLLRLKPAPIEPV